MLSADVPLRVLLADDHPMVRRGIAALLSTLEGVELAGEASTGAEAIREAVLLQPSVVVMDVRMPDMDGVEATRRLAAAVPECAVLMLTMFEDDETLVAAMRAGARGYLLKGADQEDILQAIRSVARGQVVLGPGVAGRLLDQLAAPGAGPAAPFPELTARERQILDLVAAGRNNTAIAAELGVATKTVVNHITAIFAKLRLASRAEAIVRAREAGLGRTAP
ncbi:Transcriptional regulatory protein LiaR [Frankia canadensis]|uniref:Transcriptional regulatory protein LiaR n=1 Tax=Frankia canadensis TaxID=1836972 RepID=A0A2I2KJE1_9ACTN|nr:Transcriptional regulatory protein LiaR [Frankia canadensis]SOU53081.1 Transcriptional regulatory protein LiaR [Frankia canadensis]